MPVPSDLEERPRLQGVPDRELAAHERPEQVPRSQLPESLGAGYLVPEGPRWRTRPRPPQIRSWRADGGGGKEEQAK